MRTRRRDGVAEAERGLRALDGGARVAGLGALLNMEPKFLGRYALPLGQRFDPGRHEALLALLGEAKGPRALALRGRLERLLERMEEALAHLDAAVDADPRDAEALAWRGELLLRLGKYDLALGDLENAAALNAASAASGRRRGAAAAGQRPGWTAPWLWMAAAQLKRNETEAGLSSLSRALAEDPRCAAALLLRGRVRLEAKDAKAAAADFERAARLDPACPGALVLLGRARALGGDARGAERAFAQATRLDPDAKAFYGLLISGEGLLENDRRAREMLDACIAERPRAAWAWALRGDLFRTSAFGSHEDGIRDLERAARLDPRTPWIRACLGRARVQYVQIPRGLEDLEAARRLDPRCAWLRMWCGEGLRRAKRPAAARREFAAAIRLDPGLAQARLWLGRILAAGGRHQAALPHYARAAAIDPAYGYAYAKRGESLLALGRAEEALADLDRALELKRVASEEWVRGLRSKALYALGRTAAAFEDLGRAIRRDIKKSWVALEYGAPALDPRGWAVLETLDEALARQPGAGWLYAWRGAVKLALERPAEGESDLSLAARVAPDYAWAWGWRGRLRWQTGRSPEAEADLGEALRLDPRTAWLYAWRSELRASLGRGADALADAEEALRLAPESPDVLAAHGGALRVLGRLEEARAAYDRALFFDARHRAATIGRALARGALGDLDGQVADLRRVAQLAPDLFRKTVESLAGVEGAEGLEELVRGIMTPDPEPPPGGLRAMASAGDASPS